MKIAVLSPDAQADLLSIWTYIARDSPTSADRFVARLRKKCDELAVLPRRGRLREDLLAGLRCLAYSDYLIFYRITDVGIDVVRIISGFKDIKSEFDR